MSDKKTRTIKDIIKVSLSNILKLLSGVLVAFLLPKIIGLSDYGFYKTFTLYVSYIGLLTFGICDGIYLKFGGKSYEDLEKENFQTYTFILLILQIAMSILVMGFSLLFLTNEYKIIFLLLSAYITLNNLVVYYQIISQTTSRFTELSIRTIIQSSLNVLLVLLLWILYKFTTIGIVYWHFIIGLIVVNFLLLLWYMITYRSITFIKLKFDNDVFKDILHFIKIGIPLMISNLCTTFILTIDRQFVSVLFSIETYAIYAFAYNMLVLITTTTTAIGSVIYPAFKQSTKEELETKYTNYIALITCFVVLTLLLYYPLSIFVDSFLPKYSDSLPIFRIILPGLVLSAPITIIMHNYYKVYGKNILFFVLDLIILGISIGANFIAYYCFGTTLAISVASVICITIWYAVIDYFLSKKKIRRNIKNYVFTILSLLCFYFITLIQIRWLGFLLQFVSTVSLILVFYWKQLKEFVFKKR